MFKRQREGSVVCPYCRNLVGVNDETCYNCGRRNPGMWGFAHIVRSLGVDLGFTELVLYGSILVYVLTLAWDPAHIRMQGFSFLGPSGISSLLFGASGAIPVFELGRWWTVLSAAFLHGGLIHIGFNMMWARQLIPATSSVYGQSRTVILYTLASIVGFSLSSIMGAVMPNVPIIGGAALTLGASAPIFGMLGALVRSGSHMGAQAKMYAVFLGAFGLFMPGIDNWAHAGGFLGGYLGAALLDPAYPEKPGHTMTALACIAAFVLSILFSVLHGYWNPVIRHFMANPG